MNKLDKIKKIKNSLAHSMIRLSSPFIRICEDIYFGDKSTFSDLEQETRVIFIIGSPRSGSTILYQALTNVYDIIFIDNNACRWSKNLRFGLWLSNKKYGCSQHNNFNAEYGNTRKFGGHAPCECGDFWYRWLSKDKHFIDHYEVTNEIVDEIRNEVIGVKEHFKRPFIFKNLNAGQRLRLIYKAFPDARIIFVRRDPRFIIRSILKARKKFAIKEHEWWSIMPPNVSELIKLPEHEMCAAQVYYIEKQIEEDLTLFPENNIREVHHQNFSEELIHKLGRWTDSKVRKEVILPEFYPDSLETLSVGDKQLLDHLIKKYPFKPELLI